MIALPPVGRWALGSEAQPLAEALLQLAQREGLRTAWLGREASFLSNLDIQENLRLVFEWQRGSEDFDAALARALDVLGPGAANWLRRRPAQLREPELLRAALVRVFLLLPEVLVLAPAALAQAGPALAAQLVATFAPCRLLLLAEPAPDWPAWPPVAHPAEVILS